MIAYGTCVGPSGRYDRFSLPSIQAVLGPKDQVLSVRGADSIFTAYNELIRQANALEDVEALVLLHDDVVIQDRNFAARIRRILRDPDVGVIGVVGHRNLHDLRYWRGRPGFGRVWDSGGFQDHGPLRGDVDAVDGLVMVLSPRALNSVRFDEKTFNGFLGYDADYCLSCRNIALRVVVEPFRLFHFSTGSADSPEFLDANQRFVTKWHGELARKPMRYRTLSVERLADRGAASARRFKRRTGPLRQEVEHVGRQTTRRVMRRLVPAARGPQEFENEGSEVQAEAQRLDRRRKMVEDARLRLAWVESLVPEGLLVDVGASTGEFSELAMGDGYEAFGVEASASIARSAAYPSLFSGTLHDWANEFAGFQVDAVTLFGVLDGHELPDDLLSAAADLLALDATLFVEMRGSTAAREVRGLVEDLGLEVIQYQELSERIYLDRRQWETRRAQDRHDGRLEPPRELVRIAARKRSVGR